MEKKETQLSHEKSVRSKMKSENRKPGKNLTTASRSKSSSSKRQKSPMGSEVHFAPSKYNDPEFVNRLSIKEIKNIFDASGSLDYSSSEIESEVLLPTGLPETAHLTDEFEIVNYIEEYKGNKESLFKKFNFGCLSGVNLNNVLTDFPPAIEFVPREDLCRIAESDRILFLAMHPEYAPYLLPDLPVSDEWVHWFYIARPKITKVLVKFTPWDEFNPLQRRCIIEKAPKFAKYLSK